MATEIKSEQQKAAQAQTPKAKAVTERKNGKQEEAKRGLGRKPSIDEIDSWLNQNSVLRRIGGMLYLLGFWAEYLLLLIWRVMERLFRFIKREILQVITAILTPILKILGTIASDLFTPVRRFIQGIRNIRETSRQEREQGVEQTTAKQHFKEGIVRYFPLVRQALAYVLPLAAFAVLMVTVTSMLDSKFILAVDVDGETIGYVQTQQDFEGAKENVKERIDTAKEMLQSAGQETSDEEWNISMSYHLATDATKNGKLMAQSAMADAILTASSDQIQDGTAVYVDGALEAIVSKEDNEHFITYMNNLVTTAMEADSYKQLENDSSLSDVRVEFVHNIENGDDQSGVYFTDSISSYDDLIAKMTQNVGTYTVQSYDTLWTIAETNGITVEELCAMNGIDEEYEPVTGEEMVVGELSSPLALEQKATITWQEEIPFETETQETSDLTYGKTETLQEGVNGTRQLTAEISYLDGQETSRTLIGNDVILEPVTEVIRKGNRLPNGMIVQTATGNWYWPVPNYTYVSRWMGNGHTGTDICAPYGSDVIACDSGVVVTATYHYSYGNYIVIDHGNGWQTLYAHNSQLCVSAGEAVTQGQVIAKVGSTGNSTGNHCHLEFRYNGNRVSALTVFGGAPSKS